MNGTLVLVTPEHAQEKGGLAKSSCVHAKMFQELGWETRVVVTSGEEPPTNLPLTGDWSAVSGGYRPELASLMLERVIERRLIDRLADWRPTWCVAFSAGRSGAMAARACRQLNIPFIVCLRGSETTLALYDPHLANDTRTCLTQASEVVAASREMLEIARDLSPISTWQGLVLPNPVPDLCSSLPDSHSSKTPIIGLGARHLNEKKGVGMAIQLLGEIVCRAPERPIRLELAGAVDQDLAEAYRNLASEQGVGDRIVFLGELSRTEFQAHLASWTLALQLSPSEGFCNAMVDALQIGTPIMLTNTGFLAECLGPSLPGLLLPYGSPSALADRVQDALDNPKRLRESLMLARKRLSESVDPDLVREKWGRLLNQNSFDSKGHHIVPRMQLAVIFHDVSPEPIFTSLDIPAEAFQDFLDQVAAHGWRLCSATEYHRNGRNARSIICTFDDAYEGVYFQAFPRMHALGFTGTVFVPSAYTGATNAWNPKDHRERRHLTLIQLKELVAAGWEVGGHGHTHINLQRLPVDRLVAEIAESSESLRANFPDITSFAYPYGAWSPTVAREVARYYTRAFAVESGGSHHEEDRFAIRRYSSEQILRIINEVSALDISYVPS